MQFDSWVGKIPWKRAWQPTPVFFPGKSHGQRRLAVYGPQGCKELDLTEPTQHACMQAVEGNWEVPAYFWHLSVCVVVGEEEQLAGVMVPLFLRPFQTFSGWLQVVSFFQGKAWCHFARVAPAQCVLEPPPASTQSSSSQPTITTWHMQSTQGLPQYKATLKTGDAVVSPN